MRVNKTLLTAEELLRLPDTGRRLELLEGKLFEMPPAGAEHGDIAAIILIVLGEHVRRYQLGRTFAAETGFVLARNPDTIRAADASFVSNERLPVAGLPRGYLEIAPDLTVEVISPNDTSREVLEKAHAWLAAGTSQVWVISPQPRTVTVHRAGELATVIDESGTLRGGDLLPGFEVSVAELFD